MSIHSTSTRILRAPWPSRLAHQLIAWSRARADAVLLLPILQPQAQASSLLPYVTPYLLSLVLSVGIGVYCWQRRAEAGAATYALVALSQTFWTIGYVFELISPWTFALSSLVIAWGLFHYQLLDTVPVAREAVIESMHDAVYVLDTHNRLVDLNPAACRQLDRSSKQVIGRPAKEVFATWPDLLAHYLERAEARVETSVAAGHERHHIDLHIQPLRDRRGRDTGRVIVVRDITELWKHRAHLEELVRARTAELVIANEQLRREIAERERLEAQFLQAQKLEALGQLAGGVAHDFNNLLTVILGSVEQILDDPALSGTARQDAGQIYLAAKRGAALTHQLLDFSRQQVLEPRQLDLNRVVVEMGQLLRRLIGEGVELAIRPSPDLGQVYADPGRLGQVIMNLAVNARDAMPTGGTLAIETANITLRDAAICAQLGAKRGHYIALTVSDTGVGMDAATRAQIFEPFFTTKAAGKGTGLGLATVHGIVTQSGGRIQVHSEPGRGTAFTIYLPRVDAALGETATPPVEDIPALLDRLAPACQCQPLVAIARGKSTT